MNAQQLKNSILQEAIEGRLVPQDPNDEPASVLLDKIRKEKARLVKEKKIKADKNESRIYRTEDGHWMEHFEDKKREDICIDDEIPFNIPKSWEWIRLRGLVSLLGDGLHGTPEYDITGKYFFINGNNLSNNKIVIKPNTEKVNESEYIKYRKELSDKTILVSINGTIGNVGHYNGEPVVLGKSACYFNLMDISLKAYITMLMYTDYFLKYAKDNATGSTIKNVSLAVMNNFFVPLPPLAEQKRIVAKIEELLPKVEEYGKAQESLDKLNEELPERLKKSILQEAIEGRLVPQDPNDEPASVLLDKIRSEKKRLVKEGKLKKKDLEENPISEDEKPFEIPESWEWVRIDQIATSQLGKTLDKGKQTGQEYPYLCSINVYWDGIDLSKVKSFLLREEELEKYKLKRGDLLVCEGGDYGRCSVWDSDDEMYYQNALHRIRFFGGLSVYFYKYIFEQYRNIDYIVGQGQTIKHFTYANMKSLAFPLPPLAEQHRIVAKIEQLMKEIDKLKA